MPTERPSNVVPSAVARPQITDGAPASSGGTAPQNVRLVQKINALSPKRLAALTAAFIAIIGVLLFFEISQKNHARAVETELRLREAVMDGSDALNVALMTGSSIQQNMIDNLPGGASSFYYITNGGEIVAAAGRTSRAPITNAILEGIDLSGRGKTRLALSTGDITVAWRTLDNGSILVAAAPAGDLYERSNAWVVYAIVFTAVALVVGSLMAAFLRQNEAAREAAGVLERLNELQGALSAARSAPWFYYKSERAVVFGREILEPLGLSKRDRRFSLRELAAIVHKDDVRLALAVISGEPSKVSEGTVRLRSPNGEWAKLLLRTAATPMSRQRSGVAIDLSKSESATPSGALAQSRLRDAIEAIPDAFVLWDSRNRIANYNKRFLSVFKIPAKDIKNGMSASQIAKIAGDSGELLGSAFGPLRETSEDSQEVALPKNRWAHVSRMRTAEGGTVCVASNVTDLKRRARAQKKKERQLRQAVEELKASRMMLAQTMRKYQYEKYRAEAASRSKSEFLANMSHELRTPLNAINGFSEIILSELYGPLGNDKYKSYVSDIVSSGRHLLELIDDILDMSKIEAGRMNVALQRVELEKTLQECMRLVSKNAKDADVTLDASFTHAPIIWADPRAVKQVIVNLLTNAIKFSPPGGSIAFTVQSDLDSASIILSLIHI